jgi:hypothetical protein
MNLRRPFIPIIFFTTGFLFLVFLAAFILYKNNKVQQEPCAIPIPQNVCGTKNLNLSEDAEKGKQIFNSYCAACHKLDAKSTGPALRFVDSVKYWKWLTPKKMKIKSSKLGELGIEYHQSYFYDHVNKNDLENVYRYTH